MRISQIYLKLAGIFLVEIDLKEVGLWLKFQEIFIGGKCPL